MYTRKMEVVGSHITFNLLVYSLKEAVGYLTRCAHIAASIAQIDNCYSVTQSVTYVGIELLGQLKSLRPNIDVQDLLSRVSMIKITFGADHGYWVSTFGVSNEEEPLLTTGKIWLKKMMGIFFSIFPSGSLPHVLDEEPRFPQRPEHKFP